MKQIVSIVIFTTIFSCSSEADSTRILFKNYESELNEIVNLLKADKLRRVYGRGGYKIPDSFRLKATTGPVVFRETDFTYDSSYSILFRIGFDTNQLLRSYPTLVYTDNSKRLSEYDLKPEHAIKFEEKWYFLTRQ